MNIKIYQNIVQIFLLGIIVTIVAFGLKFTIHFVMIEPNFTLGEYILNQFKEDILWVLLLYFIVGFRPIFTSGYINITDKNIVFQEKNYSLDDIESIKIEFENIRFLETIIINFKNQSIKIDNYRYTASEIKKIKKALRYISKITDKMDK